jgi:outer membrane protein TolC
MYRCFAVFVSALAIVVASTAHAQQEISPPLTLKAALQEAVRANPELVALQRDYDTTRAAIPEARYLDAPMFETQIWGWPVTTLNPARTDMYMFMGEQELPGRGKRAARELVAERETDMSRQQVAVRANEILNEVKQAYVELLLARGTSTLYEQQAPVLRQMADAATARYSTGQAGQYDTVKSVLELSRLQADAVEWRERASVAEARLNTLLGRAPDLRVAAVGGGDLAPIDLLNAEQVALERHPEVVMASATVAREEAELARLRGERKPDFVVGGGYMLQPGGAGAWTARAGITWPNAPWSRGRLNTEIDVQQKKLDAAMAHRDVAVSAVKRSVRETVVHLEAARERARIIESSVTPHVEHAFDVARIAYASNRGEFADLLDTERVLLSTRMDVVAARADVERAIADLAMATGDIPEN